MRISAMTAFILAGSLVLSGCGTAAPRSGADPGKTTQIALQKIDRICALPHAERDAQLNKLKAQTGVFLVCSQ
ncbi:MAG: hypothetical protein JSR66_20135 [Proteobacteria bacterium]|nr:hypothetical protein [Pseudomonadota bacterium]